MTTTGGSRVAYIEADWGGADYDLGDDHPVNPTKRLLAAELLKEIGLLNASNVEIVRSAPASDEAITRVHDPAYVAAVRQYSANPVLAASWEAGQWGLAAGGDTPAFAGMHEAAALLCGASLSGMDAILDERAEAAFSPQGGLHHGLANRASGFCVYNDTAVAIQAALDSGVERVAYVDIDVHHGDGTQWIFWDDPRVLTCSVHQDGQFLFPGTGWLTERGGESAPGSALNVPLPAGSGDGPYVRAITEVLAPAVRAFAPEVIVTQMGSDPHHQDPLAHLQVSLSAIRVVYDHIHELAVTAADGRWLALGGGGYNFDLVPRAWVLLFAEMIGAEVPEQLPAGWVARAEETFGISLTTELLADPEPALDAGQRAQADAAGSEVIDQALSAVTA